MVAFSLDIALIVRYNILLVVALTSTILVPEDKGDEILRLEAKSTTPPLGAGFAGGDFMDVLEATRQLDICPKG